MFASSRIAKGARMPERRINVCVDVVSYMGNSSLRLICDSGMRATLMEAPSSVGGDWEMGIGPS
eukprot:1336586-Pyramimonas_sp.AAC.1